MYEIYYDKLQKCYGQDNFLLSFMDTDSIVSNLKTEDLISELENLQKENKTFDFSNQDKSHEFFQTNSKKDRET